MDPGSSTFPLPTFSNRRSFPSAASEFRKGGFKHEVTSMFVTLRCQFMARLDVPEGTQMRLLTERRF